MAEAGKRASDDALATRLAPAKVNLYLRVVKKRADGYHDLETLFQTVQWGDDVAVARRATPELDTAWTLDPGLSLSSGVPTPQQDLTIHAAAAWIEESLEGGGAAIRLTKRIPIGGGLGGGSSDAAAVLLSLDRLGPPLPPATLHEIARGLGSDVPFFLHGDGAIGRGTGDVLERLPPAPPLTLVLIIPPFGTDTERVYARAHERIRKAPADGLARAVAARASGDPAAVRDAHHNDLAEAAIRAYPELLRFTSSVERALGRPPCMSGSGSTLFDVVGAGEAEDVVARLRALPGRRHVVVTGAAAP